VHQHEVVVAGAGFSGLAQVLELRRAGLDDVVVLEADASGGPWRDDLRRHVHFGREFTGARWDEESRTWTVDTRDGDVWVCRFLVTTQWDVEGLDVVGRAGRTLRGTWADHGMVTHLGITVSDFPNLFFLPGPDDGPGRSVVFLAGFQTRYVRQAITTVRRTGMSGLDVRAEVQQRSHLAQPGFRLRSWLATRRFDPEDFELFGRAADAARAEPDDGGRVSRTTAADQALLHDGGDEDAVAPVEPPAREAAPSSGVG
jgi:cation diffusion facilitator CzcD-associated flavoprotein CzcO